MDEQAGLDLVTLSLSPCPCHPVPLSPCPLVPLSLSPCPLPAGPARQSHRPQGVLWWDIVRATPSGVPKGDTSPGDQDKDKARVTQELLDRPGGEGTPPWDPPRGGTVTESDV